MSPKFLRTILMLLLLVMMRIHGNIGEDFVAREFLQMHEQIVSETQAKQSRWVDCFSTPSARRRMWLGIFVNIFNNLGGSSVISVYQAKLFEEVGFTGTNILLMSGFYGLAGFAGVVTNISLVADRLGRKQSMCMFIRPLPPFPSSSLI